MNRRFVGWRFTLVLACSRLFSGVQERMPAPGASSYLVGTAESFLASCRSDLEDAKKRIAVIKASKPSRDALTTLQAFDSAVVVASDAANRAGLAEQVHPSQPFRDAGQLCEQEVNRVLTDINLDKELYSVLASLDGSKLDRSSNYYLENYITRLPSGRRRPRSSDSRENTATPGRISKNWPAI